MYIYELTFESKNPVDLISQDWFVIRASQDEDREAFTEDVCVIDFKERP